MYIQKGRVKLSVVNEIGREAVVAVLGPGDFFGEGRLAGQPIRIGTATAIAPSTFHGWHSTTTLLVCVRNPCRPAQVMERGGVVLSFLQIHGAGVTTPF